MEGVKGDAMQFSSQDDTQPSYSTTASVPGKSSSPFSCNVCGRSYSRVDHLARHYRAHTREKPFTCSTCNKSFARADLLKRHSISHTDRKEPRKQHASPHLARVAQACLACANSKLKCGNEKPCQRCIQKGITCTFPHSDKTKSHNQAQGFEATKTEIEVLDMDGLEGAGTLSTLSTLDSQNSAYTYSETQPQNLSTPNPSNAVFSHDLRMKQPTNFQNPSMEVASAPMVDNALLEIDESLGDFLRDVMMPVSSAALGAQHSMEYLNSNYSGRDIFSFGMDSSLDMNELDFGWMNSQKSLRASSWNPASENSQPVDRGRGIMDVRSIAAGAEAFQKSVWRWKPDQKEHMHAEQANLSVPYQDLQWSEPRLSPDILDQRIEQNSRDRILAMLLSGCEPTNVPKVVASFPSADLLDSLTHLYFRSELQSTVSFIHLPSFKPQHQRPELNGIIAAAGAILSNVPTIRKLGFAIQESVRTTLMKSCEMDNSKTRDLQILQAYALELGLGLWSGNKRKMEIAESNSQPLVTMLRRAGHFRKSTPTPAPEPDDDDKTLDQKWRAWVEAESLKRVAFHVLIHDAQTSISLLTRPLISYAEVSLELPFSLSLWRAKTAHVWRDLYLSKLPIVSSRLPSLMNCVHDVQPLSKFQDCIDLRFSTSVILHAIWSLVSEYRQLEFILKIQAPERHWNGALISTSWHQELCQLLEHFRITVSGWPGGIPQEAIVLQELFMMNLHVSFEELQLFAGKEGNEEAQRVYPLLKQWYGSRKSREAILHAGQVLRAANSFPSSQLRDFYAVALYHCALCFWVWGMCSLGTSRLPQHLAFPHEEAVWLDGEETSDLRRFVANARGIPMIHGREPNSACRLDNPKAVMESIITIMKRSCANGNQNIPPLVENLSQLMRDLGNAAWIVSSRSHA